MQSKCAVCGIKKSRFMNEQEAKGLLSSLGIKTPLKKIPLLGNILFYVYKMNEIVNKFLVAGDKFMSEMHLKQPGFTYSACGPITKNKERIEKFIKTGNTDLTYKNDLNKACFQHDMAYGKSKDLTKRTQSVEVLRDKSFKIASDPKDGRYFLIKNLAEVVLLLSQIINFQMNFIGRLLENSREEKFIHRLETIFEVST